MFILKDPIMVQVNPLHGYSSNENQGNFIVLTDKAHAMTFKTEADAKHFIKDHKLGKTVVIEKVE